MVKLRDGGYLIFKYEKNRGKRRGVLGKDRIIGYPFIG